MAKEERIRLFFDWDRFGYLNDKATDVAKYANAVAIPLLKAMDIPLTWDNVLSTCRHPEHPRYYLEQQLTGSKYEKAAQKEQIEKEYQKALSRTKVDARRRSITGDYLKYCHLNKEVVEVDTKQIEADSTIWLTDPKEIAARKEHLALCEKLADFIKRSGILPAMWADLFQVHPETGEVSPNPFLNPYPTLAENS